MLHSQRAASYSIGLLITIFLIASPQSQRVDQVSCNSQLSISDILVLNFPKVILSDLINLSLKSASFLIFFHIIHALEFGVSSQEHILMVGGSRYAISFITAQPCLILLAHDRAPRVAWHWASRDGGVSADVDGYLLGVDSRFEQTCFGMLASAFEQSWRLN